jgi:hypothetical protein
MKPLFSVVDPEAERRWLDEIRQMTIAEKLQWMNRINSAMERLARADVRRRYPYATDREIRLRVASRRIPRELMIKAFGWDPEIEGY